MATGPMTDHASFVQARWPVLVRSLVVEGIEVADAQEAVASVLAGLRRGWARRARDQDVDVLVWSEVREAVGLPRPETGAVAPLLHDPSLVDGAESVVVHPHPLVLLEEVRRTRRRRVLLSLTAAAVACLLVGAYLAWATTRTPAPDVQESANPAPVPWYADGWLHLDEVAVRLPRLQGFVATGQDEVTYVDRAGGWHTVAGDGTVDPAREPDAAAAIQGTGGIRISHDRRVLVRLGAGGAYAYDRARGAPIDSGTGPDVRVLDAAFAPDGSITYVLSNVVEQRPADSAVRLSETGTQVLRTCTLDPLECEDVVRVSGSLGSLRVR